MIPFGILPGFPLIFHREFLLKALVNSSESPQKNPLECLRELFWNSTENSSGISLKILPEFHQEMLWNSTGNSSGVPPDFFSNFIKNFFWYPSAITLEVEPDILPLRFDLYGIYLQKRDWSSRRLCIFHRYVVLFPQRCWNLPSSLIHRTSAFWNQDQNLRTVWHSLPGVMPSREPQPVMELPIPCLPPRKPIMKHVPKSKTKKGSRGASFRSSLWASSRSFLWDS